MGRKCWKTDVTINSNCEIQQLINLFVRGSLILVSLFLQWISMNSSELRYSNLCPEIRTPTLMSSTQMSALIISINAYFYFPKEITDKNDVRYFWVWSRTGRESIGNLIAFFSFSFSFFYSHLFLPLSLPAQARVYGGLVIFCLFVLYDTQMIIEKRNMGDDDYIK